ncbi:MAG TPA: hypothetical protein VF228_15430 [Iamia sp.]
MGLRRTTRGLAIAAALLLTLVACGDEGDSAETVDTTEASAAEDETSTTEADEADEPDDETSTTEPDDETSTTEAGPSEEELVAQAESVNLVIGDFAAFGELWSAEVQPEDDDEAFDECLQSDVPDEVAQSAITSYTNDPGNGSFAQVVSNLTFVMPTVEDAVAAMDEVASDTYRTCTEEDFATQQDGTASLTTVPDNGQFTEQTVALVGDVTAPDAAGNPITGYLDLHYLRTDRFITVVQFVDINGSGGQELLTGLLNTVTERHAELA